MMEIQTSITPSEIWLRQDLEKVHALLLGFVGNGFQLALCNVSWLTTRKFVVLVIRSSTRLGRCCSTLASFVTAVDKTHRHLPKRHVCKVEVVKGLGTWKA